MSDSGFELDRRGFLRGAGAIAAGVMAPRLAWAGGHLASEHAGADAAGAAGKLPPAAAEALAKSPLVYISPLRTDGAESACHGEVWFVQDGHDALVVTAADRWRAVAVAQKGLTSARLWVGDHGVWTRSGGKFRSSPTYLAAASIDRDREAHARALVAFGKKYPNGWDKWGPRFEKGLADGSRVMLRYAAVGR